jgi:hypothetical protein
MKILVGVILSGDSKEYVVSKFFEMAKSVFKEVDVLFITDRWREDVELQGFQQLVVKETNHIFCTMVVYHGKQALKHYTLENRYDWLVWQGIDCLYRDKDDFNDLTTIACNNWEEFGDTICGALVAGRNRPEYPVCREFVVDDKGIATPEERELGDQFFEKYANQYEAVTVSGFIGADATFLHSDILRKVTLKGYEHWHERGCQGLGPDEWFMYRAIKDWNQHPTICPNIRPYHVHESCEWARYKGESGRLEDLSWQ